MNDFAYPVEESRIEEIEFPYSVRIAIDELRLEEMISWFRSANFRLGEDFYYRRENYGFARAPEYKMVFHMRDSKLAVKFKMVFG